MRIYVYDQRKPTELNKKDEDFCKRNHKFIFVVFEFKGELNEVWIYGEKEKGDNQKRDIRTGGYWIASDLPKTGIQYLVNRYGEKTMKRLKDNGLIKTIE